MAGEEGGTGSGGNAQPATAGAAPATGASAPLTAGAKPVDVGIKMDMLPKELRELVEGRSEAEQKVILNNLVGTVKRQQDTIRRLEQKPATPVAPVEDKPAKPKKSNEELILENPDEVILDVVNRHFGTRFANVEKSVGDAALGTVRSEDPDFSEYEDEVRAILDESKAEYTRENILGAYTMAVGSKQLAEKRRLVAANHNPETVRTPADGPAPKTREYTQLEKDIAAAHRKTPEEYFKPVDFASELKIPTNPPKKKAEAPNG